MAPCRGPVFSQGRAWLPPWLAASSLQSGATVYETPSMFATSWKDLEEPILNGDLRLTPSSVFKDVTNKCLPSLHLSEEVTDALLCQGLEDFRLENKSGPYALEFSQPKALELQLSLSQTQVTTDANLKCGLIFEPESEGERNLNGGGNTVYVHHLLEGSQLMKNQDSFIEEALIIDNAIVTKGVSVSPAASQSTSSTEHLTPPAQHSSQFRGKHTVSINISAHLHVKRQAAKSPSNVRDGKTFKSKTTRVVNDDIQAAIGLTVATAETLVIADIMNGCQMCHSAGPTAILDAALLLKREREASGLNDFALEDLPCEGSPDPKWDEDLDDTALESEFLATPRTDSMKEVPCGNASMLTDMQLNKCLTKFEIALRELEEIDNNSGNMTAQHHKIQCEDAVGVAQGFIDALPVLDENGDEVVTPHDCSEVAPKDTFNSRWLGGWTGASCAEIGQARHNLRQAGKNHVEYETSELSESCGLPPPAENLLEIHQIKGPSCVVTVRPEVHVEALTEGSCAEVLLALSQASVKCSLQEPLCSFVPCSVNAKLKSLSTEPVRCNGAESNDGMAGKHTDSMVNGLISGRPCDNQNITDEPHPVLETSPERGVKRMHSNSLKRYSSNPFSPQPEAIVQITEKHYPTHIRYKKEIVDCVNYDQTDRTVRDGSTLPPDKSALSGQCELVLEDSALQDSPPLIWHRGKKRRLRACRIDESNLTLDKFADTTCGYQPDDNPAFAKFSSEPGIVNHQDSEGLRQATLASKDDVPLKSLDNPSIMELHTSNTKPGLQEESNLKMSRTGYSHLRVLDKTNAKHEVYIRRGRSDTSSELFKGIDFLVTGFPASQKNVSEEVCKKIQEHGGVILSSVPKPNFSSLERQKALLKQHTTTRHSIVIAPQKVRTLKYLYGCAAALLVVRPNWLDESIAMKSLVFEHKYKGRSTKQLHASLCFDKERSEDLIFSRVAAFVHGQRSYCSKLSLLIQHGGGKVVRSAKNLMQANKGKESLIQIVVVEHQSKLPEIVKETAASFGLPIVSGDWVIDSLLDGRLISLPTTANASREIKASTGRKGRTGKSEPQRKDPSTRRQGMKGGLSFEAMVIENAKLPRKEVNINEPCVSFLGKGAGTSAFSRRGVSFALKIPEISTSRKLTCGHLYYKAVCINGEIYSAGDIVEVRPETREEKEPYVAQIESFYAGNSGNANTRSARSAPKGQPRKPCFICCRWFYRPSDTGFPCVGTGKELYLSQHFDDNAPVHSIIRRVQLVLFVDGKVLIHDNEKGWKAPPDTSCTVEAADYVCRFFYDYHQESLHQLKSAWTS